MLRLIAVSGVLLASLLVAGCSQNEYEVELRPNDDGSIKRELSAWREGTTSPSSDEPRSKLPNHDIEKFPVAELQRIAGAYGEPVPDSEAKKYRFSGTFRDRLPNDVGGTGSFTRWRSPLGDLYVYAERARGNDDLFADLDARRMALNRAIDIVIAWLDVELKDDPIAAKLHALLDGDVRRDLANLMLYVWRIVPTQFPLEENSGDDSDSSVHSSNKAGDIYGDSIEQVSVRVAQYLAERNYFAVQDIPRLIRAYADAMERSDLRLLMDQLLIAVRNKLDVKDVKEIEGLRGLLADTARIERTLMPVLKLTPEYAQHIRELERQYETEAERSRAKSEISEPVKITHYERRADGLARSV